MSKVEPNIGFGLRGWKARQEAAKRKMAGSKSKAERERVRDIRRRHREALEQGEPVEPSAEERAAEASVQPEPDVAPSEPEKAADGEPVEPESDSPLDPSDMSRDELIFELESAGKRVHPASKDATLRRKVSEARNAG